MKKKSNKSVIIVIIILIIITIVSIWYYNLNKSRFILRDKYGEIIK